jgi:hypothetical protein
MLADVFALLAGSDEIEHASAYGMFRDIALVAHLPERAHVTCASAADNLAPVISF